MDELQDLIQSELTRPSDAIAPPAPPRRKRPTAKTYKDEAKSELNLAAVSANNKVAPIKTYQRKVRDAYKYFEEAVGGRMELINILEHCPESSPAYKPLMRLFKDADFRDVGKAMLDVVCKKNDVSLSTIMLAFKESRTAQLTLQAMNVLSKHFPTVIEQIGADSTNRFDACPVCEGNTRVPRIGDNGEWALDEQGDIRTQLCYNCRGTGKIFKEHDTTNRKFFLELTGVLEQNKGRGTVAVQLNQNFKGDFTPGDGSFEQLIRAIDTRPVAQLPEPTDIIDVPYSDFDPQPSQ